MSKQHTQFNQQYSVQADLEQQHSVNSVTVGSIREHPGEVRTLRSGTEDFTEVATQYYLSLLGSEAVGFNLIFSLHHLMFNLYNNGPGYKGMPTASPCTFPVNVHNL